MHIKARRLQKESHGQKKRYIRDIKRIRPAKIALAGPDFIGVTSALQQLMSHGYQVVYKEEEPAPQRAFSSVRLHVLMQQWCDCCN